MRGERVKRVSALLVQGLEEVERLMVVDPLRRAEVRVTLVSMSGERVMTGSHDIAIATDRLVEEVDFSAEGVIFLPGGMLGVSNLVYHALVAQALKVQAEQGKEPVAICAAPSILGKMGSSTNKRFTCYPGWEKGINNTNGTEQAGAAMEQSKGLTARRGFGTAADFGLALVAKLCSNETAEKIRRGIQHLDTLCD